MDYDQHPKKRRLEDEGSGVENSHPPVSEEQAMVEFFLHRMSPDQIRSILIQVGSTNAESMRLIKSAASEDPHMNKIFVRGLDWGVNSAILEEAFQKFGKIESAHAPQDMNMRRSKGYGFVNFEDCEAAFKAIAAKSFSIKGRMVHINLAVQPKQEGPGHYPAPGNAAPHHQPPPYGGGGPPPPGGLPDQPSPGGGQGGGGGAPPSSGPGPRGSDGTDVALRKLFVRGIDRDNPFSIEELRECFEEYGEVERTYPITGKGYAFVEFANAQAAANALATPEKKFKTRWLKWNLAALGAKNPLGGGHGGPPPAAAAAPPLYAQPGYPAPVAAAPLAGYYAAPAAAPADLSAASTSTLLGGLSSLPSLSTTSGLTGLSGLVGSTTGLTVAAAGTDSAGAAAGGTANLAQLSALYGLDSSGLTGTTGLGAYGLSSSPSTTGATSSYSILR
eukprot:CAMPEP_0113935744 /NCGR_PEP_ID=MMETSP1339-20121228/2834_1 /TAXON_ID=94617 /ORGANISM="Fibrocapsa japonica" /LENGTH=445 /DNA_ID=CAMNT_0000937997 /DNA_START=52 /DNA_END=1389 /DNA_ORIENTATION=- /assembly_acc=CAM_ASM_000762